MTISVNPSIHDGQGFSSWPTHAHSCWVMLTTHIWCYSEDNSYHTCTAFGFAHHLVFANRRGQLWQGICRCWDLQGCNMLQPLNGLGENLTAPLYCCVRETPRRSEEALCSCSTRLQQDVSLGWKRCLPCGSAPRIRWNPPCATLPGDDFQQNTWIAKSLEKQLAVMPCLHGSSDGFFVSLAKAVEPRLLIAGQEIFLSSNKDRIIRGPTVQLMWMSGSLNVCTILINIVQYVYINMS